MEFILNPKKINTDKKYWYKAFYTTPDTDITGVEKVDNYIHEHLFFYNLNPVNKYKGKSELQANDYKGIADNIINQFETDEIIGNTFDQAEQTLFNLYLSRIIRNSKAYSLTFAIKYWLISKVEKESLTMPLTFTEEDFYKQMYPQFYAFMYLKKTDSKGEKVQLFNDDALCLAFSEVIPKSLYKDFATFLNDLYNKYNSEKGILTEFIATLLAYYKEKANKHKLKLNYINVIQTQIDNIGNISVINSTPNTALKNNDNKALEHLYNFIRTGKQEIAIKTPVQKYQIQCDKLMKLCADKFYSTGKGEIIIYYEEIQQFILQNTNYDTTKRKEKFTKRIKDILDVLLETSVRIRVTDESQTGEVEIRGFNYIKGKGVFPKKNYIVLILDDDLIKHWKKHSIIPLNKQTFSLSSASYLMFNYIQKAMLNYGNGNRYLNNNAFFRVFSVKSLLNTCDSIIRSYSYLEKIKDTSHWGRDIRDKLIESLEEIKGKGLIDNYLFAYKGVTNKTHTELHEDKILNRGTKAYKNQMTNYNTFIELNVVIIYSEDKVPITRQLKEHTEKYNEQKKEKKAQAQEKKDNRTIRRYNKRMKVKAIQKGKDKK